MKKIISSVSLCVMLASVAAAQNVKIYRDQGGEKMTFAATSLLSMGGRLAITPDATTYSALRSTHTLSPASASFLIINGTGTIVMASTPTVSTATAVSGQILMIMGGANPVTFQDNDQLDKSALELGSSTRALSAGDILELIYYSGKWYEIGFFNN